MREYNKGYNYFAGLPDEDVIKHQKDDTIGHRPTWFIGVNSWARNRRRATDAGPGGFAHRFTTYDPFGLFAERAAARRQRVPERLVKRRTQMPAPAQSRGQRHQGRHQGALQGTG